MSKIRLHGTSSGYTDIAPTAAAGNNTLTAPTGTGTLVAEDSSGNITISEGLVHTGDTDTKIKFPAADTITAETGGSERLRITSAGKILIGTTTPQGNSNADDLVVANSTHTGISIRSGTSHHGNIFFADGTTSTAEYSGWITYQHDNLKLTFGTNANERLSIDSNGNTNITGITTATQFVPTDISASYRNKVINGAMTISQRGTSFSVNASPAYTLDRFKVANGSSWDFDTTTTQETAGPDGFRKSLKITPDATDTPTGGENGVIDYFIEGQDCQDFKFGTSGAYDITVSFYAKTASQNNGHQYTIQAWHKNSGNTQYDINKAFTVTSSWQRFTVTFPGNTSQNILFDNNWGVRLTWVLSAGPDDVGAERSTWATGGLYKAVTGQSNFMDNTSNEFHLTGVQLEVGSSATPFQHLSFADELARCQRYFCKTYNATIAPGTDGGSTAAAKQGTIFTYRQRDNNYTAFSFSHPVEMRAVPTLTTYSHDGTAGKFTNSTTNMSSNTNAPLNGTATTMAYGTSTAADDSYCHFVCDAEL